MLRRNFLKTLACSPLVGLVPTGAAPAIPAPEYPLGTRKVLADGRVFRYMRASKPLKAGEFYSEPSFDIPIGIPFTDITKDHCGWLQTKASASMKAQYFYL